MPPKKEIIYFIDSFIQKAVSKLKPYFAHDMLGYEEFPYKSYKGKMSTWPIVALANQKNYVSVYVCGVDGKQYLAEKYKDKLGKVRVGNNCIRFKKLEDINLPILKKVLKEAEKSPWLLSAETKKRK